MRPSYVGSAIKTAHTEEAAIICLAKGNKYDKKGKTLIDRQGNLLHILSIEQI
jgi:hypothetical protein